MVGKIFITRSGYDPQVGKHIKDPYLGATPTLGACRPDIRKLLTVGDHIFVVSGKVAGYEQFVVAGFEIASKMPMIEAYERFPEMRLRQLDDGQLTGNIVVTPDGRQHELDGHNPKTFRKRISDFVVGRNLIAPSGDTEITEARRETLDMLQETLKKKGRSPVEVIGHFGSPLDEHQINQLRRWLQKMKIPEAAAGGIISG